ncbi:MULTISPECIES: Asp-tRNA(Asn)/Glu-tRNA(Gln) amidotransferase subunit GatB [unclassified Enterococcus]|uniref:Asp-tRNA(Asn)/Glu-tRNA(Gln) amidotransferase subunit GatB n=1 Tax=unclassified Enterococcus TaxID=2608891 RepID=UPI0015536F69|nr:MULTISPECIES: Asp-tRNA(Asn)/Glu-tRNA(Gln) amidotransferase subunit GatB [unclassified Enterococcus]MBS7578360.1 Asp-tRNA(Asn)/Glu-tRNA(Gln) amidotransferase subunit GatB [Enterococcus sp. MMGLQ5-2]MBS7585544.1 Asp-tRNA(Asn)/Glu-tRNA(Gln) amidotransferase subunit GatB [Enterococcus sp. MMGLQ5-1]NPD13403.1 Asp-tRNA(Asn)/Glu-tRNA(Gln) amidotransferase subunit GatB [Enterococcus sp. MMGLQ5-1]NPD38192.1 Asp-tRNA(Asn)/Glu-tRNA(Gln) amidotransferase subunit GatB [Enterococcus sp. MMGLQ5-2]
MNFETVIGLEVHVELKTNSKIFSPAPAHFGNQPNESTNIIDWGFPGMLPVINRQVIEDGIILAKALNMSIHQKMHFDRKNYFYPDNPKAYQISQFDEPIGYNGRIEIELPDGATKEIRIERAHLEEDAGKNTHGTNGYSYVDLNRQGVPLIEIVSEADMRSPEEAYAYLEALKQIVLYTGISDVKMEEGSMRVDANISLRPYGQEAFGVKTELKNLNSFSFVKKGLQYEIERQAKVLRSGGEIQQETRRYDEATGHTILMRVKEGSSDYRYFPEPDLPVFNISDQWIETVARQLPKLPKARRQYYIEKLGITAYDAHVLTLTKEMSDLFEATVALKTDAKQAANWLMGEVSQYLNAQRAELSETKLTAEKLHDLVIAISDGTISSKMAKKVFIEVIQTNQSVIEVIEAKGLKQLSSEAELMPFINQVLVNNESSVTDYLAGKDRAIKALMGQIMKATKGQANPEKVTELLLAALEARRG